VRSKNKKKFRKRKEKQEKTVWQANGAKCDGGFDLRVGCLIYKINHMWISGQRWVTRLRSTSISFWLIYLLSSAPLQPIMAALLFSAISKRFSHLPSGFSFWLSGQLISGSGFWTSRRYLLPSRHLLSNCQSHPQWHVSISLGDDDDEVALGEKTGVLY